MQAVKRVIDSPERMIGVIREYGIIPFFRCDVNGWSIEEMTAPGCWFTDEEDGGTLGPWDWKIEAVREGDIAYGKYLGGKAAFATVEWYRELMNWRRSIPKYRMALEESFMAATSSEKLMKFLSPVALSAIKEAGALEARELRLICSEAVTPAFLRSMGAKYKPLLSPGVKKGIMDSDVVITPENNGEMVLLHLPQPTEERRKELVKQCNKIGENTKIQVRNIRADVKDKLKKAIKDGLSEDLEKDAEADLQTEHDKRIKRIDQLLDDKQKEIMTV